MFYYFYFEIGKILLSFFTIISYNVYYTLTFYLNSFIENIYLNNLIWGFLSPNLVYFYNCWEINIFLTEVKNYFNLSSLVIGYYNIHPLLLYTSIFFCFTVFKYNNIYFLLNLKFLFYFSLIALLLGGLWGAGNGVWGYFWVNDLIEQYLFWLTIGTITLFHKFLNKNFSLSLISLLVFSLVILLLLRVGMFNTRHSFFDTNNLSNIAVYWNFIFINFSSLYFKNIFFISVAWVGFFLIICYLTYFLSQIKFFNKSTAFLHAILVCLAYIWVKYSHHNFSWKLVGIVQNYKMIFNHYNIQNFNNLLLMDKHYLLIFSSTLNWFFIQKQIGLYYIFIKYIFVSFCFLLFLF